MGTHKIYYKVIRKDRRSAITNAYPVTYRINRWVKAKIEGTPLMVFRTHEDALSFKSNQTMSRYDKLIIVKCHIKRSRRKFRYLYAPVCRCRKEEVLKFWEWYNIRNRKDSYIMNKVFSYFAPGTVFATEVRCLE